MQFPFGSCDEYLLNSKSMPPANVSNLKITVDWIAAIYPEMF